MQGLLQLQHFAVHRFMYYISHTYTYMYHISIYMYKTIRVSIICCSLLLIQYAFLRFPFQAFQLQQSHSMHFHLTYIFSINGLTKNAFVKRFANIFQLLNKYYTAFRWRGLHRQQFVQFMGAKVKTLTGNGDP